MRKGIIPMSKKSASRRSLAMITSWNLEFSIPSKCNYKLGFDTLVNRYICTSTVGSIQSLILLNDICRYFKAGGAPEQVVQLLPDNYTAVAQTANLMAEWLIQAGLYSNLTKHLLICHFNTIYRKHPYMRVKSHIYLTSLR